MQKESRHNPAFKPGTAGNRSLFLSLANQGCTPAIALWEETSVLSSDSYITKALSRLLQRSQVLQHNLSWQEGALGGTTTTVQRPCGKRIPPGLQASFSGTLRAWGMEALCKPGLVLNSLILQQFELVHLSDDVVKMKKSNISSTKNPLYL